MPERINLSRWWIAPVLFGIGLGVAATMMRSAGSGNDDDDAGRTNVAATLSVESTLLAPTLETVVPDPSAAGLDPDFLGDVLADDVVTTDELERAYVAYVGCLGANGGEGYYAFDIELRSGLNVIWQLVGPDGRIVADTLGIEAACSEAFLGDLTRRFNEANPPGDDLGARQRAAVVACIEPLSQEAAAAFPEEVTVDTAVEAPTLDEILRTPDLLDVAPELRDPISRCIASAGAPWQAFPEGTSA